MTYTKPDVIVLNMEAAANSIPVQNDNLSFEELLASDPEFAEWADSREAEALARMMMDE